SAVVNWDGASSQHNKLLACARERVSGFVTDRPRLGQPRVTTAGELVAAIRQDPTGKNCPSDDAVLLVLMYSPRKDKRAISVAKSQTPHNGL
ncbi:Hypothetical protein SMAX5B_022643, partial [Scophthalmus maximus]